MRKVIRQLAALLALRSLALAQGLLYSVDSTGDGSLVGSSNFCNDGTGRCTLRAAIQASNLHSGEDGISIDLPAGSVINLTQSLPDIAQAVTIFGPGAGLVTLRRNTGGNYRIFNITVPSPGGVTISGLTMSNGAVSGNGGGVNIAGGGTVNIVDCVITGNVAAKGGGISKSGSGTLSVMNCILSGNSANESGGGISNFGTLNVTNSTFTGNLANQLGTGDSTTAGGGAIANGDVLLFLGAVANITNSTLAGNMAFNGGGISTVASGIVRVSNSTLTGNHSFFSNKGGGISSDSNGSVTVKSSIIALSLNGPTNRDVSGAFTSGGFNLIGKTDGSSGFTDVTDQTGTIAAPLDPQFDSNGLRNNGGPTQTVALLSTSPAIDKGTTSGLNGSVPADQRAYARDGLADIGAFEFRGTPPPPPAWLTGAVSRKTHGAAGLFDLPLSLGGSLTVESRNGAGDYTIVLTFVNPLTAVGGVALTTGGGSVSSAGLGSDPRQYLINLTGVADAQRLIVSLTNVRDSGFNSSNVMAISMGVLLGDSNGDGAVNSGDAQQTRSRSGQSVSATNFRSDYNLDGTINSGDAFIVRSRSGQFIP